jgi:predicted metalloendopeptidase
MRSTIALVLVACSGSPPPQPQQPPPEKSPAVAPHIDRAPAAMTLADAGILSGWLDRNVDPCTDFFAYSCGGFTKNAQIPPDRSSWGTISIIQKDNEELLRKVLEDAVADAHGDATLAKLGTYYAACMDEAAVERAGIAPLQPYLDAIAKVTDARSAGLAIAQLHRDGFTPFFDLEAQQDFADATQMIAGLDQNGLGLPERKYYIDSSGNIPRTRAAYRAHVKRLFALLGRPARSADNAFRIETAIAKLQQDDITRRDPHALYHPIGRDLFKLAPKFPWQDYFATLGVDPTKLNVNDPKYYAAIAKLIASESPAALRDYLTLSVLRGSAMHLTKAWVDEAFTMEKELHGLKELPPRWRRCVDRVDSDLGELLGQSYVKLRFAGDAKARATELAKTVLAAMSVELDQLPWMDASTREAAKRKVEKMVTLVGHPDTWRRYDFAIARDDFAGNARVAARHEVARQLAKIGKPVDRFEWQMTPPTVNAYYEPKLNEMVLPAGQLQPPFFSTRFHPAVNFGSTGGGTIGHEMTHGFDDEGKDFDGDGNLRDWWSKSTAEAFGKATQCIVEQYAKYEAVPGVHLDGKLTAGENIADNGGVKLAYQAYAAWRDKQPAVARTVEGFSDDQLYFLAYGQSWCEADTPEALETMAHSNPHSPAKWRVNGVVVNQPGFASAFGCAKGAAMNPGTSCNVW